MKKRWLAGLLSLVLVLGLLPGRARAEAATSGTCGENLTWTLDGGTLTISGTGAMEDYNTFNNYAPWYDSRDAIKEVVITGIVTSVGECAFYECDKLARITIPGSVTSIGDYAFSGCSDLTSIVIPEGVTSIGDYMFARCSKLTSVSIPNGVTSIGYAAFSSCSGLTSVTIPESVTSIGAVAFSSCSGLTSVAIPESVTSIGSAAFSYCSGLTAVVIPDGVTRIEDATFEKCTSLTRVTIPESVVAIGERAFRKCVGLTSIDLPSGLMELGAGAFSECSNLAIFEIPEGVRTIDGATFADCTALTEITIPKDVAEIKPVYSFMDSYTEAGGTVGAFDGCTNLKDTYYWGEEGGLERAYTGTYDAGDAYADYAEFKDQLINETNTIHYPGSATLDTSPDSIAQGETDPSVAVTITSSQTFSPSVLTRAAFGKVTVDPGDTGLTAGQPVLAADRKTLTLPFTGTSNGGSVSITIPTEAFSGPANFTPGSVLNISANGTVTAPENPDPAPDPGPDDPPAPGPDVPVNPTPDPVPDYPIYYPDPTSAKKPEPETTTPTVVEVNDTVSVQEPTPVVISGEGESDMQHIVKPGEFENWIDRVDLPQYAKDLYTVLCIGGDNDALYDLLIKDEYNTVSGKSSGNQEEAEVESVLEIVSQLDTPYSSGGSFLGEDAFADGFDTIEAASGDRAVKYGELKEGDVVRTSAYNGIFVTKLDRDSDDFDAKLKEASAYASTAFQAFDRDHPEVFWLSGASKLRMVTVKMKSGGQTYRETYVFFVLADKDGFSMRDPQYPTQADIETAIQRRDQAVETILQTVTATEPNEQAAQLNRWLTEHNEYNTSADLHSISNWPHECLSALVGSVGTDGPVCDGYARAFKVLCGKLEIPCVLVDGYAVTRAGGSGEFHMWNSAQMPDGQWYGVDVTWNDPVAKDAGGAKSGYENDKFLLVGADTVVYGLKFSESHPPKNRAANGGVAFVNGPTLSMAAFNPLAGLGALPFTDVAADSWYYAPVSYVYEAGIMSGETAERFAPESDMTRAMVWTVLGRLDGADVSGSGSDWYEKARSWAVDAEISDGTNPGGNVTRQELAAMLWRAQGSPAAGAELGTFSDSNAVSDWAEGALQWAVSAGILTGDSGRLNPAARASRAEVAAMLARYGEMKSDS